METVDLSRAIWRKSTFSNGNGGNSVIYGELPNGHHALKDSKLGADSPVLISTRMSGKPSSRAPRTASSTSQLQAAFPEVAQHRLSFDHLRAQSFSADESRRMLSRAAEDLA